jgi:hypothetical protein
MRHRDKLIAKMDEEKPILATAKDSEDESDSEDDEELNSEDGDMHDDDDDDYGGEYNDKQPLLQQKGDKFGPAYGSSKAKKQKKSKKDKNKSESPANAGDIEMTTLDDDEGEHSNIGAIFNQINVYLGVGEAVADDADWFEITRKDKDTQSEISCGRVALSISIVPEIEYENDPVGKGREEPNKDPYLPPPNGRLSFSLNPMAIFYELCSPRVICWLVCCVCCVFLFTIMMLVGTQLSGFVALVSIIKGDY